MKRVRRSRTTPQVIGHLLSGDFDGHLPQCLALEPQWFEQLGALPEFRTLVADGVPKDALLRGLSFVRFHSGIKSVRNSTKQIANAATQLQAAATALCHVPTLPSSTINPIQLATELTALKALEALKSGLSGWKATRVTNPHGLSAPEKLGLSCLEWLLSPKHLATAMRTLSAYYEDLSKNLKLKGPAENQARSLFLQLIPELTKQSSRRPHHAQVGALFAFVFDLPTTPDPPEFARMVHKAKSSLM